MFIDEKIASMDRLRRENLRKELEERKADQDKKMLTIEEAMAGIQAGKLQMEGIPLLEFDSYIMPVKNGETFWSMAWQPTVYMRISKKSSN